MKTYDLHPLCSLFPRMSGAEFDSLVSDIKANGLRDSITTHEGLILDGGNRIRACHEAGIEPHFREFEGESIVSYVLSMNLHRRHMTAGQQAAIVASAQDWSNAQTHGGDRKTDQAATLPLDTEKKRAAISGAGQRTQRNADKVAKADPDLAREVAQGTTTLPKALKKVNGKNPNMPKPATAQTPKPPVSEPPPNYDERDALIDQLKDSLDAVTEENDNLRNQISAMLFDGTEEEKAEFLNRLKYLTEENRKLTILNHGLQATSDRFMRENNAFQRNQVYLANKLKKSEKANGGSHATA